jgi:hypothetical protein
MNNDESEYGPWIEHDGLGCPCVGSFVHAVGYCDIDDKSHEVWGIAEDNGGESWDWSNAPEYIRVILYRIRKPKGMQVLQGLLRDVEDGPKEVVRKIMEPV